MKKIIELVKYQMHIYFKGSKFVMPFVATGLFLFLMYFNTQRGSIVSNCIITYNFVFFIMVWIGLTVASTENQVTEQILLLRVQSSVYYYTGKMIFLFIVGFIVICICFMCPAIIDLLAGGVFTTQATVLDLLNAFLILSGASMAGYSLGSFFHPRVMKDRRFAIALTVLFAMVTFVRTSLLNAAAFTKIFTWILPPLDEVSRIYNSKTDFFSIEKSLGIFLILLLYSLVYFAAKSFICYKRKF